MPKYRVEYGMSVPAYGTVELEANDEGELLTQIKQLYEDDNLIKDWDYRPEIGTDCHRIVSIHRQDDDGLKDLDIYFALDESDYYEDSEPELWIVYDDDSGKIMGQATKHKDAVTLADSLNNVRIIKVKL